MEEGADQGRGLSLEDLERGLPFFAAVGAAFEGAEVFFGGRLLFAGADQVVLADEAGDGVMAAGQGELVVEALGAEAGLAAELDDLALQAGGDLVGAGFGAAAQFLKR